MISEKVAINCLDHQEIYILIGKEKKEEEEWRKKRVNRNAYRYLSLQSLSLSGNVSSDHMLEGRRRKRARVSIIQAATTCHERPWLDFISTPGRPRASSKVDIREIHKLCGRRRRRRVRRRRDCNLLRIKLMNINHRPARFTSPDSTCTSFSFYTLDRITIPSPFSLSSISFPSYSSLLFLPDFSRIFLFLSLSLLLTRWCQSPGSLFELDEFMFPRHAPRSTNNHHRHFFAVPMDYFDHSSGIEESRSWRIYPVIGYWS